MDHAVSSFFQAFDGSVKSSRLAIIKVLKDCDFCSVVNQIRSAQRSLLSLKCLLMNHKVDLPLRVVISEDNSCQKVVSRFIQKGLMGIDCSSSLSLKNAVQVITEIQPYHRKSLKICSLDIK